jgi:hypothetical protein
VGQIANLPRLSLVDSFHSEFDRQMVESYALGQIANLPYGSFAVKNQIPMINYLQLSDFFAIIIQYRNVHLT